VIAAHKDDFAGKTVVTFCTGGIRCEKAAIHMQNIGYDNVYQLEGGILKYFEEVGGAHYTGDCFVFDYRTALKCFACPTPRQLEPASRPLHRPVLSGLPRGFVVRTSRARQLSPLRAFSNMCPYPILSMMEFGFQCPAS
jgi:hypothetical protein